MILLIDPLIVRLLLADRRRVSKNGDRVRCRHVENVRLLRSRKYGVKNCHTLGAQYAFRIPVAHEAAHGVVDRDVITSVGHNGAVGVQAVVSTGLSDRSREAAGI